MIKQKLDRQSLKARNEEKRSKAVQIQELKDQKQLELQNLLHNLSYNDSNKKNYIQVKIKPQLQEEQIVDIQLIPQPLIVPVQSRARKILITGIRRNVYQSYKKIHPVVRTIMGKHIYEAIDMMAQVDKKCGSAILSGLQMVRSHAMQKGLDEERLYVVSAITNKFKRQQRLRYRGKGSGNYGHRDVSQIRITLEERPAKDMFKQVLQGKTPPILAYQLKSQMLEQQSSLKDVQKFQLMLTAKGRQQQRLMLKRNVQMKHKEFRQQGNDVSFKVIVNKILDQQASEMSQIYEQNKLNKQQSSLQQRQTLFQRNEKLNV